jgi:aryl-alcohol dehydrogenase-like predicted oxidoreductase
MEQEIEPIMAAIEEVDNRLLDIIELYRAIWPNFNRTPVDPVISNLYDAYKANGKLADAVDKGWVKR